MSDILTDNQRRAYNKKMLEILKYFIAFCQEKQLVYWASYGTAIGAVRHHSIIPWDDDIDILMPRDSYNKLLDLADEFDNGQYEVMHVKLNPDSTCRAIHICDKNTTVIIRMSMPIVNGVHIGVSPIDFSNESEEMIVKHAIETHLAFKNYFNCLRRYSMKDVIKNIPHPRSLKWILKNFFQGKDDRERYRNEAIALENYYYGSEGTNAFNIHELLFNKHLHVFKSEWFASSITMPFEDIQICLPIGYHEYLTKQYGDYMTPPPAAQQVPHHDIDYFNLKERLAIDTAVKRYEKGLHYEL